MAIAKIKHDAGLAGWLIGGPWWGWGESPSTPIQHAWTRRGLLRKIVVAQERALVPFETVDV